MPVSDPIIDEAADFLAQFDAWRKRVKLTNGTLDQMEMLQAARALKRTLEVYYTALNACQSCSGAGGWETPSLIVGCPSHYLRCERCDGKGLEPGTKGAYSVALPVGLPD